MSLSVPAFAVNNTLGITFAATLSESTIYKSDAAQTVTMSIDPSVPITTCSIGFDVIWTSPIEMKSLSSSDTKVVYTAADYYVVTGISGWTSPGVENVSGVTNLGVVTFTIPANTPAGTYTLGVKNLELGVDIWKVWENDPTPITTTLTILDTPANDPTGAVLNKSTASVAEGSTVTLTPSLTPADTDATIASTTWSSADTTVATVENGVVTGVSEGTTTITATVTPSIGMPFTATCEVTVTAAPLSPYTVSIVRDGTGKVYEGDAVELDIIISGEDYNGAQVVVNYDKDLFSCDTSGNPLVVAHSETAGTLTVRRVATNKIVDGSVMASINFTAKAVSVTTTGTFGIAGTADTYVNAANNDAISAATVGADVTITKAYTVTFEDKDGGTIGTPEKVDAGETVETVPSAPAVEYHDFVKWNDGTNDYTDAEINARTVNANVTYTATYAPKTYTVTLPAGVTGSNSATYDADYTASIDSYDAVNYDYTVTYTIGGADKTATVNPGGTFTIPGTDITGNMTIAVVKTIKGVTVTVSADYVTGYTLIIAEGGLADGYSYDGNDMFYVAAYNAYAWLVEGDINATDAGKLVEAGSGTIVTINAGYDVNKTGAVDFNDYLAAFGCYNIVTDYPVLIKMELYLRADVNGDKVVNAADIAAIAALI